VIIWFATMPAASNTPTAPTKPNLFPIRLEHFNDPNFPEADFPEDNRKTTCACGFPADRQRSQDRLIST
jgi:hypothetical protein